MDKLKEDFIKKLIEDMKTIEYIKPEDIPNIELYMDQVTTFMDSHLTGFKHHSSDKLLTKTMINNYTKNNLLPSPEKKKYSKDHMFILIFIYYMKNVMAMDDIYKLISPLNDKYFNIKKEFNLSDIYKEIVRLEEEQAENISKDVLKKYEKATESFSSLPDGAEKEKLQLFANICMLSFDVYMKKILIEKLIDNLCTDTATADKTGTKKEKAAEKKKKQAQ